MVIAAAPHAGAVQNPAYRPGDMIWLARGEVSTRQSPHSTASLSLLRPHPMPLAFCVDQRDMRAIAIHVAHRDRHNGVLSPNEIPIAFLSVEFERKAAHVALSICRAELASDD